jgi:hypothetical protein
LAKTPRPKGGGQRPVIHIQIKSYDDKQVDAVRSPVNDRLIMRQAWLYSKVNIFEPEACEFDAGQV